MESELKKKAFEVDFAVPVIERKKANTDKDYYPKSIHLNGKVSLTVEDIKKWLNKDQGNYMSKETHDYIDRKIGELRLLEKEGEK